MPTLQDGKDAIARGNLQQARLIFEAILQENPRNEEAWLGLADVLTDTEDKRICYENVLKINNNNTIAREGLRNLEPQADPLVAALSQQTTAAPTDEELEGDEGEDEDTVVSARPDFGAADETESETPTAILVAVGLGLSIVMFAVVGGLFYFIAMSLTG